MKVGTENLIADLKSRTEANIVEAKKFQMLPLEQLNRRMEPESWSILECFEHLNLYGEFYIPEIDNKIENSGTQPTKVFKSGLLGNYFANMMLPREKLNKMKTFKDKDPIGSKLDKTTLDRFLAQQQRLLKLLEKAKKINLNKTKTAISISKFFKLKLGDTFRLVIYHNQRHVVQANKILKHTGGI